MCMFKCLKVPLREIIPVFWFVGWQSGCEESQLILSHFGKMLTWNESCERQIYMAEMCVWVSLKERWGVRLSHFTDTLRDPRGRNRWKERDRACGRAAIRMRLKKSEWTHVCVPADLVLRGELLHVSSETSEARQEVVHHYLLRNDCTGS